MAINGVYPHRQLTAEDLVTEGESWGLRGARTIVDDALATLAETAAIEIPDASARHTVDEDVRTFIDNLRAGKATGDPVGGIEQ
jgi:serine/threonine-protein kinase HipA